MTGDTEARAFAHYLIRGSFRPELAARYAAGIEALELTGTAGEQRALRFIARHPWALGPLDAACPWVAPRHVLRRRLLLMLALLETTPAQSEAFLPKSERWPAPAVAAFLLVAGVWAFWKGALGLPLWLLVGRDGETHGHQARV